MQDVIPGSAHGTVLESGHGGSSSWAFGTPTSVFEDLVEDDYNYGGIEDLDVGPGLHGLAGQIAMTSDYENELSRQDWQNDFREVDFLKTYADAFQVIPVAVKDCFCDFRGAALEVKLSCVVFLRKAILSLEPCVANLEEARQASDIWRGPYFLMAPWM